MSDNIYYSPEKFGLRILHTHDFSDGSYQFDYRTIWLDEKTRQLYTGRDSGCSCPYPFEDYHSVKDLEAVNFVVLIDEARNEQREYYCGDDIAKYVEKLRYLKSYYT